MKKKSVKRRLTYHVYKHFLYYLYILAFIYNNFFLLIILEFIKLKQIHDIYIYKILLSKFIASVYH